MFIDDTQFVTIAGPFWCTCTRLNVTTADLFWFTCASILMGMYVLMYMYMVLCDHCGSILIYMYNYSDVCVHSNVNVHICMWALRVYSGICIRVCTCFYVTTAGPFWFICTSILMCVYVLMYMYIFVRDHCRSILVYAHVYVHVYVYIHVCILWVLAEEYCDYWVALVSRID